MRLCFVSLLLCLALLLASTMVCKVVSEDEVLSKISEAEDAVAQAFRAVLDAEIAGSNVSDLVYRLNNATRLLADVKNAYNAYPEDLNEVMSKADQCVSIAQSVMDDVFIRKSSSQAEMQKAFWLTFAFSSVGCFVFIVILFFVWRRIKRSYVQKLLKMKPEVP